MEHYELSYDNPIEPTRTTVTIHRSATGREVVTYTLSRTATGGGAKARMTSISGDCSSCGLGPNSQLFYGDPANPPLPTRIVDGRGTQRSALRLRGITRRAVTAPPGRLHFPSMPRTARSA